ncbi:MAG: hypothetical protein H0V36_07945 [Chloroflexi bacterium]|nr:hypothetical protein [Chloroflexota bacterium]
MDTGLESILVLGTTCWGTGGYSDIRAGMNVTVKDENGKLLGASSLGPGKPSGSSRCTFEFSVPDVAEANIYSIESGRRGALSYPRVELEAMGWSLGLSNGD